jgi:hypothetical protein
MGRIVDVPKILADHIARTQTAYAANIVDIAVADRTLGAKRTRTPPTEGGAKDMKSFR